MKRPTKGKYVPYFYNYIKLVPDGTIPTMLEENRRENKIFFNSIPDSKIDFRYAEDKWTVKEVIAHLIDTERVFSYRSLIGLRRDSSVTAPDMDHILYADNFDVSDRSIESLIEEYDIVRQSTSFLFQQVTDEQLDQVVKTHMGDMTVRSLAFVIVGHALHHIAIIKEKYLI